MRALTSVIGFVVSWGPALPSRAYHEHKADRLVAEVNFGGGMVEHVIRTADPNVSFSSVTASRGKHIRAEPIAALYEQGRVHHVGGFPELEDELCLFSTTGYMGRRSPNRADALVWALTELMIAPMKGFALYELERQAAAERGSTMYQKPEELTYAVGSIEFAAQQAAKAAMPIGG